MKNWWRKKLLSRPLYLMAQNRLQIILHSFLNLSCGPCNWMNYHPQMFRIANRWGSINQLGHDYDSVINLSLGVPRMSCATAAILDWFSTPLLLLLQSAEPTQTTINNCRCQRRSYKNRSWCSILGTLCKLEWSSKTCSNNIINK